MTQKQIHTARFIICANTEICEQQATVRFDTRSVSLEDTGICETVDSLIQADIGPIVLDYEAEYSFHAINGGRYNHYNHGDGLAWLLTSEDCDDDCECESHISRETAILIARTVARDANQAQLIAINNDIQGQVESVKQEMEEG